MRLARLLRLLSAIVVFAVAAIALRGYVTDDTYIHLRYAQNLLDHGEFSFNPGHQTYGATSVVWVLGLALLLKLGLPPVFAAWVLGAACGLGVLVLAEAIVTRLTFGERWKTLVLLVIVCDVWFLRWTFSGMETPLATLLLLVALWPLFSDPKLAWLETDRPMWPRYLAWGVGAGLAGLVRPEYMVVVPVALPVLLWFEYFRAASVKSTAGRVRARPHAPLLAAVVGWVAVVGPWLVFARMVFGRFFPGTAAAKSTGTTFAPLELINHLLGSLKHLVVTQGLLWVGMFFLIVLVLVRHQALSADWGRRGAPDPDPDHEPSPAGGAWSVWGPVAMVGIASAWTVVLLGGLAFKQVWVISRYVSPLGPVLILAMSVMAEWLMSSPEVRERTRVLGRQILYFAGGGTILFNAWVFTAEVVPHARDFPTGVRECYVGMGERLAATTPPDAVVAALDIGAVGFASDRRVVDLMGLVSPEILALGAEMGFEEMVATGAWVTVMADMPAPEGHRYLIDRTADGPRWDGRILHGYRFELMDTCILRGVGLREPQPWTVALYRLVSTETGVRSSDGG